MPYKRKLITQWKYLISHSQFSPAYTSKGQRRATLDRAHAGPPYLHSNEILIGLLEHNFVIVVVFHLISVLKYYHNALRIILSFHHYTSYVYAWVCARVCTSVFVTPVILFFYYYYYLFIIMFFFLTVDFVYLCDGIFLKLDFVQFFRV